jgi:hypothetical protein
MRQSKYNQITDAYPMLKHPEKYTGTRPLTLRSGWEIKLVFKWIDINPSVISWKSESTIIKYLSPLDNKYHRYYMDFTLLVRTKSGEEKEVWIEVKPFSSCSPPKEPKRKTDSYIYQLREYFKNQSKWSTTKKIIEEKKQQGHNCEFIILTEKECPFFLK